MNSKSAAARLVAARNGGPPVDWSVMLPATREEAYDIQDATLAEIGPIAGWKVGAKGIDAEPICAPIPMSCILASGTRLSGNAWALRGIEVEVALRVGQDLDVGSDLPTPSEVARAFDAVLPAIEVVETRLDRWKESPALAQLADLQSHGALVLGDVSALHASELDLRSVEARLLLDGVLTSNTTGGNPAGDVWRLLAWLANHCVRRGHVLRRGQFVTTGSCTGMTFARVGQTVSGSFPSLGEAKVFL